MKTFIHKNFMLESDTAQYLYHEHAKKQAILDYHCHLNPRLIAEDYQFDNLGELWLSEDHYKWRAMRANGIEEQFCTGKASDWEKFEKWAETLPYSMRNPLYHWSHLELKTAFGIKQLLNPQSAREIYEECTLKLRSPEFSVRELMKRYQVEAVCTTDDPVDSLEHHQSIHQQNIGIKVYPTWRPDKIMNVDSPTTFNTYIDKLSEVSGISISQYSDLVEALQKRHDFFAACGCKSSDHGLDQFYSTHYTQIEIDSIFKKINAGNHLNELEIKKIRSAIMYDGAIMDFKAGWVQQFHYGVMRNNNTRLHQRVGVDIGTDSINDFNVAQPLSRFLDRLDASNQLTKTIIYNLNPRDNELIATMIGNFQDGSIAGKIQWGSGWWFLDQKQGIENQINTLSNQGLLSRFIGMLTDSRSFISYSRHEYFRRILCNIIGNDVDKGLLPASELPFLGKMIEDISYNNTRAYFNF